MPTSDSPVAALKNIGPCTAAWLHEIGIHTRADLERIGAVMAYRICKHRRKGINRLLLYALQGALDERHYASYTAEEKARLTDEADGDFQIRYEA